MSSPRHDRRRAAHVPRQSPASPGARRSRRPGDGRRGHRPGRQRHAAQAADPTAQVWVTTPDGAKKLSAEGTVAFTGPAQSVDIRVDANSKGQRFTGAGASVTGASAHLIQGLPQDKRNALMTSLFSSGGDGIGLSYLRQPLGSSDFNADSSLYTYEDNPGSFSIDRDKAEIIPVLKQATSVNPAIRFMGTPGRRPPG